MSQPKTRRDVDTVLFEWYKQDPRVSVPVVINLPGVVSVPHGARAPKWQLHSPAGRISHIRLYRSYTLRPQPEPLSLEGILPMNWFADTQTPTQLNAPWPL